ncbi:MAG: serine hydrolase [Bacteroidales bacterium]
MKKFTVHLLASSVIYLIIAFGPGNELYAGDPDTDAASIVRQLIEDYDNEQTPGGVIWVMRDNKVVYQNAFGMANLSYNVPFDLTTPTNIGSTSKQFTAFAIALLEDQGQLSVEDDIREYIPELPQLGDTVRLRHLISHTSGYREYLNSLAMSGLHLSDHIRRKEIIALIRNQPKLQNTPGDIYNYNNTGYALLAMVVEKVTGEDFPDWMQENVFKPLGMEQTLIRRHPGHIVPGRAQGYSVEEEEIAAVSDIYASMGPGGIYTTPVDLEKWIRNFYDPVVGSPEIIEKMTTPFLLNNGKTTSYGYGLVIGELNGLKMIQHGGADVAHRSVFVLFPEVEGAVVTQSNNNTFPDQIAKRVAEAFFSDLMDIEESDHSQADASFVYDPEKFDKLSGRYEMEAAPGFIMEFTREEDQLYAQATGQPRFEIFSGSDSTFYLTVVEASMTFHRNEDGEADAVTLHQNGNHRLNRITEPAWEPSADDLDNYTGRYFSEELEAFYRVEVNDEGKLILWQRRLGEIPLKADDKDAFAGAFPIMNLNFIRNAEGGVTAFEASSGRSTGIIFEKQ